MPDLKSHRLTPLCEIEAKLSDGRHVCLRTIRPSDETRIRDGIMELSDRSRYLRFFSAFKEPPENIVKQLGAVDGHDHIAWGAILLDEEHYPPIGAAHAIRSATEPSCGELAIAVLDDYQGHGLARMLLAAVFANCSDEGIPSLEIQVMAENRAAIKLIESLGAKRRPAIDSVYHFSLDVSCGLDALLEAHQPSGVREVLGALGVKAD